MKLVIFGASGMIGQRILAEALRRGHNVTAIVRDPSQITEKNPNLHVQAGNILDAEDVAEKVTGHEAVISAFGPKGTQGEQSVIDAARSLIAGLTAAGVQRLVVVGGAGSLEVAPGARLVDTPEFPAAWKGIALAHADSLEFYRQHGHSLEWTYFSPAAYISPGERTGVFQVGGDQLLTDAEGQSRISAEDYAVALLNEIEHPQHIRGRFTVAY